MEKPTIPKGTRDFGPGQMAKRQFIFGTIRTVFQKYGFQPLETPTMENLSTLTGKYGEEGDQLLFKILNSGDFLKEANQEDLAARNSRSITSSIAEKGLRYDLTVPFARYVVMNRGEMVFPFRRYQIQPVWRADRPQKGRYREFYQCDADVVGTKSLLCEAEIVLIIRDVFHLLGIRNYTIKINHRGVLAGLAALVGTNASQAILFSAIDKLDKIGEQKVRDELKGHAFTEESLTTLFDVLNFKGTLEEKLAFLSMKFENISEGVQGLADLKEVFDLLTGYGYKEDKIEFDLALARGLSYYTGCIFEVKINDVTIGSVSGGGRYDDLTGVFGLPDVSGVGISFGVDRLYDALEELQLFPPDTVISATVLVAHTDEVTRRFGLSVVSDLRKKGISSEIYPDVTRLKKQLDYANRKSIPFAIVIGSNEASTGVLSVKELSTGTQYNWTFDEVVTHLRKQTST